VIINNDNIKKIAEAISSLTPMAEYVMSSEGITWLDSKQTQPTDLEIEAEMTRLQSVYDAQEYARNRAAEYPSIADQLDDIYHNGIDAWKATIKTTKDKYPKP
jgi:hypothetical protein